MPPRDLDDRRPTITPQLAVRVAVLGGIALVLFAAVFFRLWFLQVLSGDDYVSQARENRVRKVRIEAPRGDIVDRKGETLVTTRPAAVARIVPSSLPRAELDAAEAYRRGVAAAERERLAAAERLGRLEERERPSRAQRRERLRLRRAARRARPVPLPGVPASEPRLRALYRRLGEVLDMRARTIHSRVIRGIADAPYSNVTIKTDIPRPAFNYLRERRDRYPGVEVETVYLRQYPHDTLAAQLFGTLREISPNELRRTRYRGVSAGARIGKDGIEETYDSYLRGEDGYTRVVINALGSRDDRRRTSVKEPVQGQQLMLTLDLDLQRAAQEAMQRSIGAARGNFHDAKAGAFVAMDPRNGEVLALGSYPSFDANVFAKPIDQATYERLSSEENGAPLFNRATSATYPTGSTFKPITALAALESGVLQLGQVIHDDGSFELGNRVLRNAKDASYGTIDLVQALKVSSDYFFYQLGAWSNDRGPVIQRWARRIGIGRPTGIDLPGEFAGLVPDRRWVEREYRRYARCVQRAGLQERTEAALYACGGVEDGWTVGDNVNLAIGQGFLQATPLQMAVAYSTIANGGRVVRPHLGLEIEDGDGHMIEEVRSPARRRVQFNPAHRTAILEGLRRAAKEDGGTSAGVFKDFPFPVHGKTGTVERPGQDDQAWYAAYVPHETRPIVLVTTIERGGFGAETAAPAARLILSEWFDLGEEDFRSSANPD